MGKSEPHNARWRRSVLALALGLVLPVALLSAGSATAAGATCTKVIVRGSSLSTAFSVLRAGDTLCLRGGDYTAVKYTSTYSDGTPGARVTVRSYPGERARIVGLQMFVDPDYWTLYDLEFISGGRSGNGMLSIIGSTGLIVDDVEAHQSVGGANVLIGRSSRYGPVNRYTIRRSYFHGAPASSNLYLNPGADSTGGLVERNILSKAGFQNLKVGWGSEDCVTARRAKYGAGGAITIRYNTLHNPVGPVIGQNQPLAFAEPVTGAIDSYRNLIYNGRRDSNVAFLVRIDETDCNAFTGTASVRDTLGYDPEGAIWCEEFSAPTRCKEVMGTGLVRADPVLNSKFVPQRLLAQGYGRYAPAFAR